ncbi:phosphatase PAP2 family protein [uncultured Agrococcus sp.]|uniref:phosphatase PAP2 family protein n=1 Tax=uncultured Agrococcus sp. TaxID=382258 RepID=UPI0025D973CC|nr:phosphatase PAP2 family protein [uncultured Agrococcus sp.]
MRTGSTIVAALVFLGLAALLGGLVAGSSTQADEWWHAIVADMRSPALVSFALGLDLLGGGFIGVLIVPLGIAVTVLIVRGWRSALYAVTAFASSALLVQVMKSLFGRVRPEDLLVAADFGSFPSGHTANAATIAIVLGILFPRWTISLATCAWALLMAFTRTLLAAHWLTDTLGGALLGIAAALLITVIMRAWIEHDRPAVRESVQPLRG